MRMHVRLGVLLVAIQLELRRVNGLTLLVVHMTQVLILERQCHLHGVILSRIEVLGGAYYSSRRTVWNHGTGS